MATPVVTVRADTVTDLISPLEVSSAVLQFNEGQALNNQPAVDPILPAIAGTKSPWVLTQWNHDVYIYPTSLQVSGTAASPVYSLAASDSEAAFVIRSLSGEPGYTFNLYNSDGTLTNAGGRSLYLSTNVLSGTTSTFDQEIDLSLDVRVSYASASYSTATAAATGAVLAMAYTGFGVMYVDPVSRLQQFVFMQLNFTQSGTFTNVAKTFCLGNVLTLFNASVPAGNILPFQTDTGALHHLQYNVTTAVQQMLSNPAPCDGVTPVWTAAQRNPANWHLTSIYFGSETENTDLRPAAVTHLPQGHAALDLDVANLQIVRQ